MWSSRIAALRSSAGNDAPDADRAAPPRAAGARGRRPSSPRAAMLQAPVAHEVEQDHRPGVAVGAARPPCCRAGRRARTRRPGVPRGLSSPSKRTNSIVCRGRLERARELRRPRPCRTRRRWRPRSRGCPSCRSGRRPRCSPARARARCRSRCAARPAPPGSARAGAIRRSRRGEPCATSASRPGAGRARPGGAAAAKAAAPVEAVDLRRAACAGAPSASSSTKGRLSVATSATRASPSATCTASTMPSSFTDAIVAGRLWSWRSRDTRIASARSTPPSCIRRSSRRTCTWARWSIFEGPPPRTRGVLRAPRVAPAASCRATARSWPSRRFEMGRPFWVDDPTFNLDYHVRHTALPKPGSDDQLRQLAGRIFSQRLDRSKPLWEIWIVQGLEGGRFALISKTHHALVDGVSGVDIATVLFDLSPVPAGGPRPRTTGRRRPSRPTPSSWPRACQGPGPHADRAGRARARSASAPGRTIEQRARGRRGARRGRLGRAEPRARRAAQRADRAAPARALGAEPAGRLQGDQERARRDRERRRARGRGRRARPLAARPRRAHRGARAARARAGLDPRRRRARRARQPDRRDARAAARLRGGPGRAPAAGAARRWAS